MSLEDVDEQGDQAIHYSAKAGSREAIQFLLDKGVYKCVPGGKHGLYLNTQPYDRSLLLWIILVATYAY